MKQQLDLKFWLIGLGIFAVVIAFDQTFLSGSKFTILDHQAAATARCVDLIQETWASEGIKGLSLVAMLGDIAFIFVYSWGAWRTGRSLSALQNSLCKTLGMMVTIAAVLFFLTDLTETLFQIVQMLLNQGVDLLAKTAAFAQPIKVMSFVATFFGVLIGWIINRFI